MRFQITVLCLLPFARAFAAEPAPMEEIYLARSVTESRNAVTAVCEASHTGFETATESLSSLRAISTAAGDGRMTSGDQGKIGEIRICTGPSAKPGDLNFYGEGRIAGVAFRGRGLCVARAGTPVEGLTSLHCFLDLSGLPARYRGGLMTTNSITSRNLTGGTTDPPGYTQTSMVTIRLWKKPE